MALMLAKLSLLVVLVSSLLQTSQAKNFGHQKRHHHRNNGHHHSPQHYENAEGDLVAELEGNLKSSTNKNWNNDHYVPSASLLNYDVHRSNPYELSVGSSSEWIEEDMDYMPTTYRNNHNKRPLNLHFADDSSMSRGNIRKAKPRKNKKKTFYDGVGSERIKQDFHKEINKDYDVLPNNGKVLTTSRVFSNTSQGGGKFTYSTNVFYDDPEPFQDDDLQLSTTTKAAIVEHPVPMASRSENNINKNYNMGGNRWTLKYKGMLSEEELNNTRVNITAKMGGGAFLPCKVGHLGDRQISWIRRRDWHVLTSGKTLYAHDKRFSILHEPGSQDWTLHIKWVDMSDAGSYECQVSTGTGIISLFVKLDVVVPEASIPGDGQYHVDRGSAISLKCYIINSPAPPQYILWHHNGELLNFLRDRPDIHISDDLHKIRTYHGFQFAMENGVDSGYTEEMHANAELMVSRLQVELAEDHHSGNYSCSAPNTKAASTLVFITEGDKTAAVQRIDSGTASWKSFSGRDGIVNIRFITTCLCVIILCFS